MSDELIELIADDLGRKVRVVSPEEEFAVVYHDSEEDQASSTSCYGNGSC